jgi:hypothetical protein
MEYNHPMEARLLKHELNGNTVATEVTEAGASTHREVLSIGRRANVMGVDVELKAFSAKRKIAKKKTKKVGTQ